MNPLSLANRDFAMDVESRSVALPDFLRTSTFRMAGSFAIVFALSAAILFAFIYWQTALHETARIDRFLVNDAAIIARKSPGDVRRSVSLRVTADLHRITYAALFDRQGTRVVGNLATIPADLPIDGRAHPVLSVTMDESHMTGAVRAVARKMADGGTLIIGRNTDTLAMLRDTVVRALGLGVIPAMLLAILAGAFVSRRAQLRVKAVHRSAERIMRGDLQERLPTRGTNDDFDRLAGSVNQMLDEIWRLLDNVKRAGNDIAHDLRTPLARLRTRLERGKETARGHDDLHGTIASAIVDLDQTLAMVTTVLRIGQIEADRRRSGFTDFDLTELTDEVAQIYQPVAEDKNITLSVHGNSGLTVHGDRDLLLEAIANLIQNAIKFTTEGGRVDVAAAASENGPRLRVTDNGPGIPVEERDRVFDRFHRLDTSRGATGSGLGLSLVSAIARFHGFTVTLRDANPGCIFEIDCRSSA